jgi:hypothetical protein
VRNGVERTGVHFIYIRIVSTATPRARLGKLREDGPQP